MLSYTAFALQLRLSTRMLGSSTGAGVKYLLSFFALEVAHQIVNDVALLLLLCPFGTRILIGLANYWSRDGLDKNDDNPLFILYDLMGKHLLDRETRYLACVLQYLDHQDLLFHRCPQAGIYFLSGCPSLSK